MHPLSGLPVCVMHTPLHIRVAYKPSCTPYIHAVSGYRYSQLPAPKLHMPQLERSPQAFLHMCMWCHTHNLNSTCTAGLSESEHVQLSSEAAQSGIDCPVALLPVGCCSGVLLTLQYTSMPYQHYKACFTHKYQHDTHCIILLNHPAGVCCSSICLCMMSTQQ